MMILPGTINVKAQTNIIIAVFTREYPIRFEFSLFHSSDLTMKIQMGQDLIKEMLWV